MKLKLFTNTYLLVCIRTHVLLCFCVCLGIVLSYICFYVLSSVLWYPLRFPHKIEVQYVFSSSCLMCVIYVCLRILVYNTHTHTHIYIFLLTIWVTRTACSSWDSGFTSLFLVGSMLIVSFLCCVFCFVCIRPVSCVPTVASFFWIVHSWSSLRFSQMFIYYEHQRTYTDQYTCGVDRR